MDDITFTVLVMATIIAGILLIGSLIVSFQDQSDYYRPEWCQKIEGDHPVWCQNISGNWTFDQGIYDSMHHV